MKSNVNELRNFNDAELVKQLDDLYQELFNLRFQRASGQVKNLNRFTQLRRQIARIKTIQRERQMAGTVRKVGA